MLRAVTLVTAAAAVAGNIQFSRKISQASKGVTLMLKLTGDGDVCTDSDQYGSNNCNLQWNDTYNVDLSVGLPAGLGGDSRFTANMGVKGLIPLTTIKVNADCPLCGANCTVTVPIVKQTFSFAMPKCSGNGSSIDPPSFPITIPASVPCAVPPPCPDSLPALTLSGDITLKDASGNTLLQASINVKSDKVPVGPAPAPPPPMFSCWDNKCTTSGTGTSKEACEAVCGGSGPVPPPAPPAGDKYACTGGKCVQAATGVDKQTCTAACA